MINVFHNLLRHCEKSVEIPCRRSPCFARNDEISYPHFHAPAWECKASCVRTKQKRSHAGVWERLSLRSVSLVSKLLPVLLLCTSTTALADDWLSLGENPEGKTTSPPYQLGNYPLGNNAERHYPPNKVFNLWVQDEKFFKPVEADKIEIKKILEKEVETFKLDNAVPAIGFKSGTVDIPDSYVEKLRSVLVKMKNRSNVRLHFIGHSDTDKLGPGLRAKYINNIGLSKYRAETTAEYFQRELDLPPDAVTFDGVGSAQPITSNNTSAGKQRNRRVEVQVWYDEITEVAVEKEIIIPAKKLNRLKVCRKETVCKLSYKKGNARRARLQNLVKPMRTEVGQAGVPEEFVRQISEALNNLSSKGNLVVRFVGHTDNIPLGDAEKRIYGNHTNLSSARARYVMLDIQDRLSLPNAGVSSAGKGLKYPIASNGTEKGRSFNRRVEVEFWYDDPFEQFTENAQACPESAGSEIITLAYDPPSGPIKAIRYKEGVPVIPKGYSERLARTFKEAQENDRVNVRLQFIGYTNNERLDRRTAMVYGDDIGLSASRARRAMELIQKEMDLPDKQVEFEGHGFVHSEDVVSTGFIQFDGSRVDIRILYDELALLDDQDNLEIERINREAVAQNPYALNLMRITVDGEPLYDPYKSSEDIQRCTDVALEAANIQFRFNNLQRKPRLNITAWPNTIRSLDNPDTQVKENKVYFKMYNNYRNFIDRAEVRLFNIKQSTRSEPVAIVPLDENNRASWHAEFKEVGAATKRMVYILRVYGMEGEYDETTALPLWIVNELDETAEVSTKITHDEDSEISKQLMAGFGENHIQRQRINIDGGTVIINGNEIPKGHEVWLAGKKIPVNENGEFVSEELFPRGLHTIEIAVLDKEGNGELFLRDMEFARNDWFYVGLGDITASLSDTSNRGPAKLVTQNEDEFNNDLNILGRFAYYVEGNFGDDWQLTSSADTQEAPIDELFTNFLEKNPRALIRRLDPDLFYPTFGDDSTLEERAPTSGKLYLKLQRHNNYGILGNFTIGYLDTTLMQLDRGLYGVTGHFETEEVTSFGEQKFLVDGYAAEPGTISGRDEFRGTGGSLYFLRHQDVLIGSDRVRIEVRDKDSGIVIGVKNLVPVIDYDLDYIQGRILLSQPLSSLATDGLLVSDSSLGGNPVFLVSRYEYTPGFTEIDTLTLGGRAHYWFNDYVKLGATISSQKQDTEDSKLNGIDLTLRKGVGTWVRIEAASSEGAGADTLNSNDGGFSFNDLGSGLNPEAESNAYRIEGSVLINEVISGGKGTATFYAQQSEAGFSAPGQLTPSDLTLLGGRYNTALTKRLNLDVKLDSRDQDRSLKTEALDVSTNYQVSERWRVSGGGRFDTRDDGSTTVVATQKEGDRLDLAVEAAYDSKSNWTAYSFAQGTAATSGNRKDNNRVGTGGSIRPTNRLTLDGELSVGDQGTGVQAGTDYLISDRTNVYTAYTFETERTDNGLRSRRGNWNTGMRSRYTDTISVYGEERYTHGDVPTGLTHAFGADYIPSEHWNFGGSVEAGTLVDKRTSAETDRLAVGLNAGYNFGAIVLSSALEYRVDDTQSPDITTSERKTWLMKNNLKYQIDSDWRFLAKANFSKSTSSLGSAFDGDFTELVMGYGYRPIDNDRLNTLMKYTYFYNLPFGDLSSVDPLTGQVVGVNNPVDFIQKSHIISFDAIYDLTQRWSIGGKYAYRQGEIAQDRVEQNFFKSRASLYILRADWHFTHRWDALIEGRLLDLPDAEDQRSGALVGLYRHIGNNIKVGVGYNFTDFSDDLTNLDFDSQGVFINFVGKI
ncbi:Flagellar motor protein [hydrothermal vent metagenome]|uniref:Flagellar motor protein n=1 Tax=hydrothermal vent metagenome TaxID=652676 RepID=A0A3B0W6Y5_9ZZZZ